MLVTMERIQAVADKIAAAFAPNEIILFGSYAYGTPNDESDVDLLVILPQVDNVTACIQALQDAARAGWDSTGKRFPLDIVPADPVSLSRRIWEGDFFLRDIVGKGKSLYRAKGEGMSPQTTEWVRKAEGDWNTLGRELRARVNPTLENACFHAQQCAEKYLKAMLQEDNIRFGKTHDLEELLTLALPKHPGWKTLEKRIKPLLDYAAHVRYPGFVATEDEARAAKKNVSAVRDAVRGALGI